MKCDAIMRIGWVVFFSFLTFSVNAEGLTEYLQNPENSVLENTSEHTVTQLVQNEAFLSNAISASTSTGSSPETSSTVPAKDSSQLKNIIELVVAGIVGAALIIVVLVTFLGKWLAGREKKLIKKIRIEAEEDSEHITSAATTIREQEKETTLITLTMRSQASDISEQQKQTEQFSKEIIDTSKQVKEHEKEITEVSSHVKENMSKIQKYWDNQVNETVDTISLFQHKLSENINIASEGLETINLQKEISDELLRDVLSKHSQQNMQLDSNTEISDKISDNLTQAYKESNNLLSLLKKQQEQAERSLNEYAERLNNFEEQAYEQFDTSFQVADLARQELSANLDENRKHIETMRRQEEQSHGLNNQIAKNLETLDYSKIVKIAQTLDTTQNMFEDIHHKVDDTRVMLEELKQIEEEIKQTASNVETVAKNQASLEKQEANINDQINELVETVEDAENPSSLSEDISNAEKEMAEGVVDALDNPSESIRGNTTVAITDYKMASGDSSTPLSFFRDIKKSQPTKK